MQLKLLNKNIRLAFPSIFYLSFNTSDLSVLNKLSCYTQKFNIFNTKTLQKLINQNHFGISLALYSCY